MWCQSLRFLSIVIQGLIEHNEPFPLFMTRAKREFIDSAVFFDFLLPAGAIVARVSCYRGVVGCAPVFQMVERWNFAAAELFVWDCLACPNAKNQSERTSES